MEKFLFFLKLAVVLTVIIPATASANPLLEDIDALHRAGGTPPIWIGGIDKHKEAIELGMTAVDLAPDSYEASWKLARACAYYTYAVQEHLVPGWEKTCRIYAGKGMTHAEKAMKINPDGIEGTYFFAFNAGMYSFGVSILGAVTEGLKNKTQHNFEIVYSRDRYYDEGNVLISLARFWHQLPWPMKNRKESLRYYREYQASPFYGNDPNAMVLIADLLADMREHEKRREAEKILETAVQGCSPYYLEIAREALEKP